MLSEVLSVSGRALGEGKIMSVTSLSDTTHTDGGMAKLNEDAAIKQQEAAKGVSLVNGNRCLVGAVLYQIYIVV